MKKKLKIVTDQKIPFLKGVLEPFAEVVYLPGSEITKESVGDADALIVRTRTKCNARLLEGSKVRFIATATIGYDHIDTIYCDNNGITWQNAPGCNSSSVEQYVLSTLLTLAVKKKIKLADNVIGVVGVGHVGSKVARVAELLGMTVLLNDPPREREEGSYTFVSLERIKKEADFITFHVPLSYSGQDATYHMVNSLFLNSLSKRINLINTSRGEVVDTHLLKLAIKSGVLASVVLDVWENEPLIDLDLLWSVDIATPHIAGYSVDGKANGTSMSVRGLSRFFNLGIDNWFPFGLPVPDDTEIIIDTEGKDFQDILYEAVRKTYNVLEDDERLRKSVNTFEKQRGAYPVRREYGSYKVIMKNSRSDSVSVLSELGFYVLT